MGPGRCVKKYSYHTNHPHHFLSSYSIFVPLVEQKRGGQRKRGVIYVIHKLLAAALAAWTLNTFEGEVTM